jgi:hypothetical protein
MVRAGWSQLGIEVALSEEVRWERKHPTLTALECAGVTDYEDASVVGAMSEFSLTRGESPQGASRLSLAAIEPSVTLRRPREARCDFD